MTRALPLLLACAACVEPLPAPELVDRLEILGVQASPSNARAAIDQGQPIQLATLAAGPRGIPADAGYEYAACPPSPLPPSGPPDCLPPHGILLPVAAGLGSLSFFSVPPPSDGGTLYVSVRVRADGEEAVGLKRIGYDTGDWAPPQVMTVDGVPIDGLEPARVTQGSHVFDVEPGCPQGAGCFVAWYFTAGALADTSNLLVDTNHWQGPLSWVAPAGSDIVWVFAVTRANDEAGGSAWSWAVLQILP